MQGASLWIGGRRAGLACGRTDEKKPILVHHAVDLLIRFYKKKLVNLKVPGYPDIFFGRIGDINSRLFVMFNRSKLLCQQSIIIASVTRKATSLKFRISHFKWYQQLNWTIDKIKPYIFFTSSIRSFWKSMSWEINIIIFF